jgi:hypothetical protein
VAIREFNNGADPEALAHGYPTLQLQDVYAVIAYYLRHRKDDPQDGWDHVDGHRSLCLVLSPYTKRGQVVSQFYNQTSVLHTMDLILGVPPMNQMDALAPVMTACFMDKPNLRPYKSRPASEAR